MPQKLPALKPAEMIRALEKAGFYIVRQTGSHVIMYKEGLPRPLPVPRHARELKRSLQNKIIKEQGLRPKNSVSCYKVKQSYCFPSILQTFC